MKNYYFKIKKSQQPVEFRPAQDTIVITNATSEQEHLKLSRSETRALELLIKDAGHTKSRDELLGYAWDDRVVGAGSLNQCIFSIRNILGDEKDHEIIQTIPRRGYRFNFDYALLEPHAPVVNEPLINDSRPEATISNSVVLSEEEISMLQEVSRNETSNVDVQAGLGQLIRQRSALALMFGASLLISLVLFIRYSDPVWHILMPGFSFHTVHQHGVTINLLESDYNNGEFVEYISSVPLPPSVMGEVWVYARQNDIGLSCIKITGKAVNTVVPYHDSWRLNILSALTRCLS